MKNKIVRTFLTAILVHILLAITLYYTLGWADELPDELTARPTLVLLGTFASAVLWFNNFRVLFYVIDVSDRKSILGSLGKMNTMVRKSFAIVLAICILLPSFIATAIAADVTDGFSQKASDSGYFCVDDLEKNSDILIKTDTDAVTFVEDGLQIYLSINTKKTKQTSHACLLLACHGFTIIFALRKTAKTDRCAFLFGSTVSSASRA